MEPGAGMRMAPQNADAESLHVHELPVGLAALQKPGGAETREDAASEGSIDRIPVRLWVMHGAVMFGREFCYAMETALVTPILLQIGEWPWLWSVGDGCGQKLWPPREPCGPPAALPCGPRVCIYRWSHVCGGSEERAEAGPGWGRGRVWAWS